MYIKIPENQNALFGLDKYKHEFGYKEILTRSIQIVINISTKFHSSWDDI